MIVGAGSAGCVLAGELSTAAKVLLLEAGGSDRALEVAIPAAYSKLFKTNADWNFSSEAEPGAEDRSLYLPRGKMVGGSSSINAMLYMRGRATDYETWAALTGSDKWGWDHVLSLFKAMESNERGADDFHGDGGPVRVEDLRHINPLTRAFVEAALQAGHRANHDFNGAAQEGIGYFQVTQNRGRRWSAADAYLTPARSRPTLQVESGAHVSRIKIERGRAIGVEYVDRDGVPQIANAHQEVILSAGAYGSPHLLQLSGIGEPDHLSSIGIAPLVASPEVGLNLQDHPVVGLMYDTPYTGSLDHADTLLELARWALTRRGRLTSPVAEACLYARSESDLSQPDIQFHFGPACFDNHGLTRYPGNAFTFGPLVLNPESKGTVMARSDDPSSPPAIQTNVLQSGSDLERLVAGLEMGREIARQPPLDPFRGNEVIPGSDVDTRDGLRAFARQRVEFLYHPVGTCRMGGDDGVVDAELRVRGVDGLRVIDASVMPTIVSGNTHAPTMMIAANGAEMILSSA